MAAKLGLPPWSRPLAIAFMLGAAALCGQAAKLRADGPAAAAAPQPIAVETEAKADTPKPEAATSPPPGKPGDAPGKPGDTPAKEKEKEKDSASGKPDAAPPPGDKAKPEESPKSVQRPGKPSTPPNPAELKVRPDGSGKVRFNFTGQPWLPVLEWLAEISAMSLDWQEVPGDYLNLTTQRSYTVAEARDVINRHLLARGYTLLCQGEVLTVANVKKLDPSMVPRLEPDELDRHDSHELVKVSFPLTSLLAQTAVEELKPMLSPNGKLVSLAETNRLEAMDAVANLREIHAVIQDQQSTESQHRNVREFKLKHARASEVSELLAKLLDMEMKPGASGMPQPGQTPDQAMMIARMQQQQQMNNGGQPPGGPGQPQPGGKSKSPLSLAVNERQNSILVHAGPDKMAVVAQIVEAVDIPADRQGSLLTNVSRMQVYRLSGIDPEPVVKTLQEIGNLDPSTRLEVDKKNHAIIVYAPLADHVTIRAVVEKLAGSERKFEVIRLRRLSADYVAGTIDFMLGSGGKKEKTRPNPFFGSFESPRHEPAENGKEFHVDADVEHNRLLLWANDVELTEIENLLAKLGEIPVKGGNPETTRVIDGGGTDTQELIEQIRRAWPSVGNNPLLIRAPGAPAEKKEETPPSPPASASPGTGSFFGPTDPPRDRDRKAEKSACPLAPTSKVQVLAAVKSETVPAEPPPVTLSVGPDGKILITSEDTQALDRLEELAARLATPRKDYKVFHLKYAWAVGVAMNLQDFFKEEKKDRSRPMPWWYMDFGMGQDDNADEDDRRLSKRRKMKFISDVDTNSILVEGADPGQLKTIEELIKLYDSPPPTDTQSMRKTEIFHMRYSKAKAVAETVKDVYRDLLSANDKALASPQNNRESPRTFIYSTGDSSSSEQKTPKFKGLLSIGVDEQSNSLAVSAPAYLFEHVTKLVKELDEAAAPDYTVRVVKLGAGISPTRLKETLDAILNQVPKKPSQDAAKPAAKPTPKPGSSPGAARPRGATTP
jgi:type II secretory pathway component GspD/PulD (secretin)